MSEFFSQFAEHIETIISTLGYPGIALVMFLENVFPPIPSELIMPYAGFLVTEGHFNLIGVIVAGTFGSVAGSLILYYIGYIAEEPVVRSFVRRYGYLLTLSENDLDRALNFFTKYGEAVVFFGRLIPIIRSIISIPAGMNKMPLPKFLLFTTLGASIWTTLLAVAGYKLGENWERAMLFVEEYQFVTVIVIVLAVTVFVAHRARQWWLQRSFDPSAD